MKTTGLMVMMVLAAELGMAGAPADPGTVTPLQGKVIETMDSGGYTYMLVQQTNRQTWVATKQMKVAVGEGVLVPDGWMMKDFESRTLNRRFDWILFASGAQVEGQGGTRAMTGTLPPGHPPVTGAATNVPVPRAATPVEVKPGTVTKAPGGYTVEECHAQAAKLEGKEVAIRGVVVKYNPEIMGRNWLHLRDGSGSGDGADLAVTTAAAVQVGETVVVKGRLARNRDFGAGYTYAVLVEDATVSRP